MNLKYYPLLLLLINNCSGCENNNNEKNKQEKSIPIKPIYNNPIYNDIISDIRLYTEDKKPLSKDIKNKIEKLVKEKGILDSQKKTLKDIQENLNNKDKLKKIIDNSNKLDSVITGTIECEKNTEELKLFCIDKSNSISKEEILRNIKVFINNKEINKDKISIHDGGIIYCKIDNLKKKESLNIRIEINNALMNKITNMSCIFILTKYTTLNLSNWNTSNVTDMNYMFATCTSLKEIKGLENWNTSNVTDMSNMFMACSSLTSLPDISKWNTNNVSDMMSMFNNCMRLTSLPDISKWNTSNVTNMSYMFKNCNSLKSLPDISNWDTSKVKDMNHMFYGCNKSLNIPTWYKKTNKHFL